MKNLRVLVFSATFGAGHLRAAEALIEAIRMKNPRTEINHLDCGEFLSKTFNNILKNTYIGLIKHSPRLWGSFYRNTARIAPDSLIQRFLNNIGRNELEKVIRKQQPDIIICTYPTVAGVLAQLRLRGKLNVPVIAVVTDYAVHSQWIHAGVDMYIVGCQQVSDGLAARGIRPECIKMTGIPVNPAFERALDKQAILSQLGLSQDRQTLLIMGGAYGVLDSMREVCRVFGQINSPVQLIVVCGQDEKLYHSLDDIAAQARNPIVRFGFINNVEEMMTCADLMITKAGGLTVTEALTKRLPLVIYKPIPGQEEENAVFLNEIGAGRVADTQAELIGMVQSLLAQPGDLQKMRAAAARAVPGRAAEQAIELMMDLLEKHGEWRAASGE